MAYGEIKVDTLTTTNGTVDLTTVTTDDATTSASGYMSAADKTKLDGIEASATADQTGAEIKAAYEAEADTNAFTDADHTKLDGIEAGAEVNTVTSVNGQTGAVTVSGSTDLTYTASTRVLASSTGTDATLPEVVAAGDSGLMTGADKTKLDGIETGAEANVATDLSRTLNTTYITINSSTGTNVDLEEATTSQAGLMSPTHHDKLDGIETGATADQTGAEIKAAYEAESDTNAFTDADHSKLDGIEAGAEVNTVTSVNTATGAVVLDADDIDDTSTAHKFVTASDVTALSTLSSDLAGKAANVDIQEFTSSGTWTKPTGAKMVYIEVVGGGGGGGGGAKKDDTSDTYGAGGGGAGAARTMWVEASDLSATETVTVGAGGAGGAELTTVGNGNTASDGGTSSFSSSDFCESVGGQAGGRARNSSGVGASGDGLYAVDTNETEFFVYQGRAGGGSGNSGGAADGDAGRYGIYGPGGGGAGGGVRGSDGFERAGGAGGGGHAARAGVVFGNTRGGGASGGGGSTSGSSGTSAGDGGGGGGGGYNSNAGSGGDGGFPGGGGGGGGTATNGNGGAGGDGGDGVVRVYTYF